MNTKQERPSSQKHRHTVPPKDDLSHFREKDGVTAICTQHCTIDERQTDMQNTKTSTDFHLKPRSTRFQTVGGSETCLSRGHRPH